MTDDGSPMERVTWHIPRATMERLRAESRRTGAAVAEVARRALEHNGVSSLDVVTPGAGAKVSSEVILPARVEPGPVPMGVLESIDPKTGEITAKGGPVARRAHRWVSVAKDSPVKHCERCHLTERTWQKHGGQPEVCDG